MSRRHARVTICVLLAAVAFVILPFELFIIAAIVVLLTASWAVSAHWYQQAFLAECEATDLRFSNIGLTDDLKNMTEDYDSTLQRLSEVLDEHALCPAPVDPAPVTSIAKPLRVVSSGKVPTQREGGAK